MGWYNYYPRSRPKAVKGGIKAQSKKGGFGKSWWAKQWINLLESFNIGARLGRGRSYARNGQVADISIEEGKITAKVQGSMSTPYKVSIKIKPLSAQKWEKAGKIMAGQAIYSAKLLSKEMPENIEEAFKSAGTSLFPEKLKDIESECSCPDWSNPCKHIAAVYYLIGEEFDRDPFLLFLLRGMTREGLMELIKKNRIGSKKMEKEDSIASPSTILNAEDIPLDKCLDTFWQKGKLPDNTLSDLSEPPVPAVLIKRIGPPPLWRGSDNFMETMQEYYALFTKKGMEILINEPL